ncbi:hypothetical protein BaRGS_00000941, partial [Batillaria attramentaria]
GILPSETFKAIGGGAHNLGENVTAGEGMLCEIVLTVVLVLTVLMAAVDPQTKSNLAPLAIGFAVFVDILAGISVTGASMNPARSFGPAVVVSNVSSDFWKYHYIYWVGPLIGAIVAAVWYRCNAPHRHTMFFTEPATVYQVEDITFTSSSMQRPTSSRGVIAAD